MRKTILLTGIWSEDVAGRYQSTTILAQAIRFEVGRGRALEHPSCCDGRSVALGPGRDLGIALAAGREAAFVRAGCGFRDAGVDRLRCGAGG